MTTQAENGWVKYFIDGSRCVGSDTNVYLKKTVSWSHSRDEGILRVSLTHNGATAEIIGLGLYWQADTFVSTPDGVSCMTKRRIERYVSAHEEGKLAFLLEKPGKTILTFSPSCSPHCNQMTYGKPIVLHFNTWVALEVDAITGEISLRERTER